MTERERVLVQTSAARQHASAVLRALEHARRTSEAHLQSLGKLDSFKRVTGRSSLDNAIATTQRLVDTLDTTVAQCAHAERLEPQLIG